MSFSVFKLPESVRRFPPLSFWISPFIGVPTAYPIQQQKHRKLSVSERREAVLAMLCQQAQPAGTIARQYGISEGPRYNGNNTARPHSQPG